MDRQPLFIAFCCYLSGVFCGIYSGANPISVLLASILCGILLISIFIRKIPLRLRLRIAAILFIPAGYICGTQSIATIPALSDSFQKRNGTFIITEILKPNSKNQRYTAEFTDSETNGLKFILSVPKENAALNYSEQYYSDSLLLKPYQDPEFDFEFNYADYLRKKGIYYYTYAKDIRSGGKTEAFSQKIKAFRKYLLNRIDENTDSPQTAGFTKAFILADRTDLDKETVKNFRNSGLVHILAISGTHIALLFGVLLTIFSAAIPYSRKNTAIILSLAGIWIFAALIGFGASVSRSCIMLSVYYLYKIRRAKPDLLHALGISGYILTGWNPLTAADLGFQLSFSAVLGIYAFNGFFNSVLAKTKVLPSRYLRNIISMTLSAQLATAPLLIYYFHQISIVSLLSNAILIPISGIVMTAAFLYTALCSVVRVPDFLRQLYEYSAEYYLKAVGYFGNVKYAMLGDLSFSLPELLLSCLCLVLFYFWIKRPDNGKLIFLGLSIISTIVTGELYRMYASKTDETLYGTYHKNYILIERKGTKAVLYHTAVKDSSAFAQNFVQAYKDSRRITELTQIRVPDGTKYLQSGEKKYLFSN